MSRRTRCTRCKVAEGRRSCHLVSLESTCIATWLRERGEEFGDPIRWNPPKMCRIRWTSPLPVPLLPLSGLLTAGTPWRNFSSHRGSAREREAREAAGPLAASRSSLIDSDKAESGGTWPREGTHQIPACSTPVGMEKEKRLLPGGSRRFQRQREGGRPPALVRPNDPGDAIPCLTAGRRQSY